METALIIVCLVGLVVLLVYVFCLQIQIYKINRTLNYVKSELPEKVSQFRFEHERKNRYNIEDELCAIKKYLKIKSVKQDPKLFMVGVEETL